MTEIMLAPLVFVALVLGLSALVLATRRWLVPQGRVPVTVNGAQTIEAPAGATLLEALSGAGIQLPAACGGKGTCGLCRVAVTEGGGPVLPTEAGRLSAADLRKGLRLACQVKLRGPVAVRVDPALISARPMIARAAEARALTPTIRQIVLDLPEGATFSFTPGDFVLVTAPPFHLPLSEIDMSPLPRPSWADAGLVAESDRPETRAYSLANRPEDEGLAVLLVRLALPPPDCRGCPPGVVSSWLFARNPGDEVRLAGPFGEFHIRPGEAEMVFVGGGVGMAPLRAMIHAELARGSTRRMTFFYGARSLADLIFAEEFEALAARHGNFSWVPVLSEPARGEVWEGQRGFVHEALVRLHLERHAAPEACEYYLCGPPVMTRAVVAALEEYGVDRDAILHDDFGG